MTLPYRRGVGIMLVNAQQQIFMAQRLDMRSEAWQMPQGGIDEGEDAQTAALRELGEETSITNVKILAQSKDWLRYDLPEDLIPQLWGGKFRGQEQWWFLMQFLGEDSEVNLATEHPEFSQWKWVAVEEAPRLIVPFKRALYEEIIAQFRGYLR